MSAGREVSQHEQTRLVSGKESETRMGQSRSDKSFEARFVRTLGIVCMRVPVYLHDVIISAVQTADRCFRQFFSELLKLFQNWKCAKCCYLP